MMQNTFHCSRPSLRLLASLVAAGLFAAGCQGPATIRRVFVDYSQAYADVSNQQMLLNLARRANAHPIYFLQMGSINSTFQFQANAVGNAGQNRTHASGGALATAPALTDAMTLGGTIGATIAEQPTFSFVPLSGSSFAAAIFNPIDPKIFFTLYDQGLPADQLLRVMAQSVTITEEDGTRTFMNVLDADRPMNYRNFLTMASLARQVQKKHLLRTSPDHTAFVLTAAAYQEVMNLRTNEVYRYEEDFTSFIPAVPGQTNTGGISIVLRTFEGMLTALATESQLFDHLIAVEGTNFTRYVPPSELRPILRIKPIASAKRRTAPVARIDYLGEHYAVVDEEMDKSPAGRLEFSTWNRDVFNLLNLLYVQIALDPSKLPVQQLIQVK